MIPGPPFDYITPFNPDPFRRGQWAAFTFALKKQTRLILFSSIFFFVVVGLSKILEPTLGSENQTFNNVSNFLIQVGFILIFIILLTYLILILTFSRALKKQVQDFTGKSFHTTISETALTIRNPVTLSEKTYPLKTITLVKTNPDFLILKHEHEYLYIGTEALHENKAYEFFVSNITSK